MGVYYIFFLHILNSFLPIGVFILEVATITDNGEFAPFLNILGISCRDRSLKMGQIMISHKTCFSLNPRQIIQSGKVWLPSWLRNVTSPKLDKNNLWIITKILIGVFFIFCSSNTNQWMMKISACYFFFSGSSDFFDLLTSLVSLSVTQQRTKLVIGRYGRYHEN